MDLPQHSLVSLKQDNRGDTKGFAREMVSCWLKEQGNKPTYKNLVIALRRIGENGEAKKLCDKFGKWTTSLHRHACMHTLYRYVYAEKRNLLYIQFFIMQSLCLTFLCLTFLSFYPFCCLHCSLPLLY